MQFTYTKMYFVEYQEDKSTEQNGEKLSTHNLIISYRLYVSFIYIELHNQKQCDVTKSVGN